MTPLGLFHTYFRSFKIDLNINRDKLRINKLIKSFNKFQKIANLEEMSSSLEQAQRRLKKFQVNPQYQKEPHGILKYVWKNFEKS